MMDEKIPNMRKNRGPFIWLAVFVVFLMASITSCSPQETVSPNRELALELWNSFEEHYAFFEVRQVDWQATKESLLNAADAAADDAALFDAFCKYLQKFNDAHVNLVSDSLRIQCNGAPDPAFYQHFPTDSSFQALMSVRDATLADIGIDSIKETPSRVFQYGVSPDNKWGYFRIKRFYGISEASLEVELDRIFDELIYTEVVILDVRTNPGGNDPTAIRIAEHFYRERTLGYFKQERNGPGYEDFSELEPYWIEPKPEDKPFLGKVYLVTNGATSSAGDVFAMMIYQRANVVRVGNDTEGIFSDLYRDTLSNGWAFTLSHQRYFSATMEQFEDVGVPVEYQIENTADDLKLGFDPVIRAVQQIEEGTL